MAAQYTEISLEDMEKFLKRGFRALRPKQKVQRGEYSYDLSLSPNVAIRVWTSVQRGTASGAGVGEDAIRVQLMGVHTDRPLMTGKAPIVKRTQGWRNTLQTKIEDLMEQYEERQEYWEARGKGEQMPTTPATVISDATLTKDEEEMSKEEDISSSPAPSGGLLSGTFTRTKDGTWAAKIEGSGYPGARALLETKGNRKVPVTLVRKLWAGRDNFGRGEVEVWAIEDTRRASSDGYNYDYR